MKYQSLKSEEYLQENFGRISKSSTTIERHESEPSRVHHKLMVMEAGGSRKRHDIV